MYDYLYQLIGEVLVEKKKYKPNHKNSYTLVIKKKNDVVSFLEQLSPFLRIHKKEIEPAGF